MFQPFTRHAAAATSMVTGSFVVFFTVVFMNGQELPPTEVAPESAVAFDVEQKKPPPKRKRKEQRQKQKPRRVTPTAPPTPNLAANISAAAFSMSGFDASALGNVSTDLIGTFSKKGPMAEGAVDEKPKPRHVPTPRYPAEAQKRGITGYVMVSFYVDESGRVTQVKVLDSQPAGTFDAVVKDAVLAGEFQPATYQGEAVGMWLKRKYPFKLTRGS